MQQAGYSTVGLCEISRHDFQIGQSRHGNPDTEWQIPNKVTPQPILIHKHAVPPPKPRVTIPTLRFGVVIFPFSLWSHNNPRESH